MPVAIGGMRRFLDRIRRFFFYLRSSTFRDLMQGDMRAGVEDISTVLPVKYCRGLTDVVRWAYTAVVKLWSFCTTSLLILFLFYWLYGSIAALILLIGAVIGFFYNAQDILLYYPDNPPQSRLYVESPLLLSLPFENIYTKTRDGVRINMHLVLQPDDRRVTAPTVLYFHGNAGNIGHRMANVYFMYIYLGVNVLLVEYRGYGKSEGTPSEMGLCLDAQAAMDYILQRMDINKKRIVVFGRSLGGAVAVNLCARAEYQSSVCALLLENTFTSLPEIARQVFNINALSYLPLWCFKSRYPSISDIRQIRTPTLFLSGQSDALIPPTMMTKLYEASRSVFKRIARFDRGTHNETWRCGGYYEAVKNFLDEVGDNKNVDKEAPNDARSWDGEPAKDTDTLINQ